MPKRFATVLLLSASFDCVALDFHLHGFDFHTCTRWEFTTDIVAYRNPEYLVAAAKAKELRNLDPEWTVFEAINHKTYGPALYGVCRYVVTPSNHPFQFECKNLGTFPLSGSTFSLIKDRGLFSSSYRCTKSCTTTIQLIHDQTSEDKGNVEMGASWKKFKQLCQKSPHQQ